jgi:hypothetical protein
MSPSLGPRICGDERSVLQRYPFTSVAREPNTLNHYNAVTSQIGTPGVTPDDTNATTLPSALLNNGH